jgi:hypothetical protein
MTVTSESDRAPAPLKESVTVLHNFLDTWWGAVLKAFFQYINGSWMLIFLLPARCQLEVRLPVAARTRQGCVELTVEFKHTKVCIAFFSTESSFNAFDYCNMTRTSSFFNTAPGNKVHSGSVHVSSNRFLFLCHLLHCDVHLDTRRVRVHHYHPACQGVSRYSSLPGNVILGSAEV